MARNLDDVNHLVVVCVGKDCRKRGASAVRRAAKDCLQEAGVRRTSLVLKTKCAGMCKQGPVLCHQPSNTWLTDATPKRVRTLLTTLLEG